MNSLVQTFSLKLALGCNETPLGLSVLMCPRRSVRFIYLALTELFGPLALAFPADLTIVAKFPAGHPLYWYTQATVDILGCSTDQRA